MPMPRFPHLEYLKYVLRHKRFVYEAGRKMGLGHWQLLIHDWQKFTPKEWFPYVHQFYIKPFVKDSPDPAVNGGYFHSPGHDEDFDRAWLHHIHYGPHHWQHWVLGEDEGEVKCLEMPSRYVLEMLADWHGAGRAQLGDAANIVDWYHSNRHKQKMHPNTRQLVATYLLTYFNNDGTWDANV